MLKKGGGLNTFAQSSGSLDQDGDEDPLDAFMKDINTEAQTLGIGGNQQPSSSKVQPSKAEKT